MKTVCDDEYLLDELRKEKGLKLLNKAKLSKREMDELFGGLNGY